MTDSATARTGQIDDNPILEFVVDAAGRYVDANEPALALAGYSIDELRSLRIGALAAPEAADAALEVWAAIVAGLIEPPSGHLQDLYAKDGRVYRVRVLDTTRRDDGALAGHFQLVSRRAIAVARPEALHEILALWRESERRLAAAAASDPARDALEADARELRELYESELGRHRLDLSLGTATVAITSDARYADPSPEFLELLRVDRESVEGASVGRFGRPGTETVAETTFRAFVESGDPIAISEAVLVLGDGSEATFRATTVVDASNPQRYVSHFERLETPLAGPPSFRTAAQVLAEWRTAERDLAAIAPGDPRRFDALYRVALLRAQYQRLTRNLSEQPA